MTYVKVNHPLNGFVKDFLNEFPASFGKTVREDVIGFPPVNILEQAGSYQLQLAAPGMEKSDFSIKLDGKILSVSAGKKAEQTKEGDKMIRREFGYKAFNRSFTLDEQIDAANISAKYENGILTVDLPKKEETRSGSTQINIQ